MYTIQVRMSMDSRPLVPEQLRSCVPEHVLQSPGDVYLA